MQRFITIALFYRKKHRLGKLLKVDGSKWPPEHPTLNQYRLWKNHEIGTKL